MVGGVNTNVVALRIAMFIFALVLGLGGTLGVEGSASVPLPNYTGVHPAVASTFFWFSSVEVGVCYAPNHRLSSVKDSLHCTHQEDYDVVNNTWELPQTCVALQPLGSPLNSAIIDTCTSAGGIFNSIKPAPANTDANSAVSAITSPTTGTKGKSTDSNGIDGDNDDNDDNSGKKDSSLMNKLTMGLIS